TPPPMQPLSAQQTAPAQPSPWSPPAAPVVPAHAQVAPPAIAAPVVAAPQVAAAAAGKRKAPDEAASKGKFRETMWFKKGDLDAEAAQRAAAEAARTGKTVDQDKADSLPIDERYKDDGSITRGDKDKYSLRSGHTQAIPAMGGGRRSGGLKKVSEDALVSEMKGGRAPILIAIAIGVIAIIAIVAMIAR